MNLTFLGTAASEGYPNAFCRCANCEQARALGGPSLRKRSAALINDDLLLDLGPDLVAACQLHGRSLARVCYCLQTHAHADHLDRTHIVMRTAEYGVQGAPRLHFYASGATLSRAMAGFEADFGPAGPAISERLNLQLHRIEALQAFTAGSYQVTALPANHDPSVDPLLYAIHASGRTIFYGVDTAPLPEATWQAFHRQQLRFDVVILDHTYGTSDSPSDHLNARQFVEHVARLREEGLLSAGARVFAHHLAHNSNPIHAELADIAAQRGYEVAYDGLTV